MKAATTCRTASADTGDVARAIKTKQQAVAVLEKIVAELRLDEQRAARDHSENAIEDATKIESTSSDIASPIGQRAVPQRVTREREGDTRFQQV